MTISKEQLENLYIIQGKSSLDIAEELKTNKTTILKYLHKYDIPTRSNSRAGRPSKNPKPKSYDLHGKIFGNLTVIDYTNGGWRCQCSCGKIKIYGSKRLLSDKVKSCGCKWHRLGKDSQNWSGYGDIPSTYISSIKSDAVKRNLEFSITIVDCWNKFIEQNGLCAISKVLISFDNKTASLDRIDSSKGYTIDNIQWVHKIINEMKWDYDQDEFISWCRLVVEAN